MVNFWSMVPSSNNVKKCFFILYTIRQILPPPTEIGQNTTGFTFCDIREHQVAEVISPPCKLSGWCNGVFLRGQDIADVAVNQLGDGSLPIFDGLEISTFPDCRFRIARPEFCIS